MKKNDNSTRVEFARFIVVGVLATLIHVFTALATTEFLAFNILYANLAGFSSAVLVSYICNALWSFGNSLQLSACVRFVAVSSVMLGVVVIISEIAMITGLSSLQGIALVVLINPVFSFLLHKYWTFARTGS